MKKMLLYQFIFILLTNILNIYCNQNSLRSAKNILSTENKRNSEIIAAHSSNIKKRINFLNTNGNIQSIVRNSNSPNIGDIIMETQLSSQSINITDPTVNSSQKNIIDWFWGLIGFGSPQPENPLTENVPEPPKNCPKCTCGIALKHKRIVGGVETLVNEYPWMVALHYSNRFYCGASLINNKYLLTAAHCVNGERISAVFFDHDRENSLETTTFSRKIKGILKHNNYGKNGNFNNDIALVVLDQEVPLNNMIRPVCLPPTGKSFTGQNGVAIGWGKTSHSGQISTKLREVTVPIMSNMDCHKTGYGMKITDNMLCAGFPEGQKDSCQGDSGGPLHVISDRFHQVVGIVSWGEGCAQANYPGVYTRVNRYITWIESNTKDACYC